MSVERLTYMDGGKWRMRIGETEYSGKDVDRIAAYEDTGLEPEDLKKPFDEEVLLTMTARWMGTTPGRLRELVEAERDGRCVLLPCKVGDRIYKLFCGDVIELEVERIVRWSSGFWKLNANTNKTLTDWKGFEIDFADFGKTVFLTSEAAEAALKGGRKDG